MDVSNNEMIVCMKHESLPISKNITLDDKKECSQSPQNIIISCNPSPPPLMTHKMYSVPPILPLPLDMKVEDMHLLPPPPSILHSSLIPPPLMTGPLPPPLMSHSSYMDIQPPTHYPMYTMDNALPPPILPPYLMSHSIPPSIYGRFPVQFKGHDFPLPPPPPPTLTSMNRHGIPPTDPNGFMSIEYRCDFCGFVFNTKQKLSMHKKIDHGQPLQRKKRGRVQNKGGMRYFCQYCKRGFTAKQHFDYHVRTHTGEKPFKCVQCGKAFRAKHSLKNHMRIHSGERPYQCKLCGKFFRQLGVMKNHIKNVHENNH